MLQLRRIDTLDRTNINSKQAYNILSSKDKYLVKVNSNLHFVSELTDFISKEYPEVPPEIIEVYVLNPL